MFDYGGARGNEVSVDELLARCDVHALEGLDARSLATPGRRVLALWSTRDAAAGCRARP